MNLNSLKIMKNVLPQHNQKHVSDVSGAFPKKHLQCTISRRLRTALVNSEHLESKFLYILVNLRSKISVPET